MAPFFVYPVRANFYEAVAPQADHSERCEAKRREGDEC